MTAKNDSFFKKYRAIRKKISENPQNVVSASSTEGIFVWTSFSGRNGNFSGIFSQNLRFWPFLGQILIFAEFFFESVIVVRFKSIISGTSYFSPSFVLLFANIYAGLASSTCFIFKFIF